MREPIRVARVDELVPGKGVTMQVGARAVTVYNVEGRLRAHVDGAGASPSCGADWPLTRRATCTTPPGVGHRFCTTTEDSPARNDGYDRHLIPVVDGEYVVLYVEEPA